MIETEREIGERKIFNFKELKLISPETANQLGISGESPVFISPYQDRNEFYNQCGHEFGPLVYQVGYEVSAHHFHENCGGIYYRRGTNVFQSPSGWVAVLEPRGRVNLKDPPATPRAEKVSVSRIRSYCMGRQNCGRGEISSGVAVALGRRLSELIPVRDIERHPDLTPYIRYAFKITEGGGVLFSAVD